MELMLHLHWLFLVAVGVCVLAIKQERSLIVSIFKEVVV